MANTAGHTGTDRSDLSAWLDGELPEDELARLEEDLARNPELKAELDALESVVSFVRATAPAQAPGDFTDRLMARIDGEERVPSGGWRRPLGLPLERWAVGLAAAAAIVLLVVRVRPLEPVGGEARTLSPAALEAQTKDGPAEVPPPVPVEPNQEQPAGKYVPSRVPPPTAPPADAGPADAPPVEEAPPTVVQGTDAPFLPTDSGPLPAVMYTVKSADPSMKRELLATVARYGEVLTDGGAAPDATMAGPTERLRVLLRQDQLAEFQQDLTASGFSVRYWFTGELAGRDTVEIEVVLQQISEPAIPR